MSEDERWRGAFKALMIKEDQKPLAHLLATDIPIPRWLRQELAELLNPTRALLLGNDEGKARIDLRNSDCFVFKRTQATRRKIQTYEKKLATGMAVLDAIAAGKSHADAVGEVMAKLELDQTEGRYVTQSAAEARKLPGFYKSGARKL